MTESEIGRLLIDLALLFTAAYLLGAALRRVRIPVIVGALFVGMAARFTYLLDDLSEGATGSVFTFLAQIGVLFLLFYIGLQIDLGEMRRAGRDIVILTVISTMIPFLLGVAVGLAFAYGLTVAFVVGLTRMPTAEAVVVPILDEFGLVDTRVGHFIVGAGVLDDVIELFMVAFVSVWIGVREGGESGGGEMVAVLIGAVVFVAVTWVAHRWLVPALARLLPADPQNLTFLVVVTLFTLGGLSEAVNLGLVVGAIVAGVIMRPVFTSERDVGVDTGREIAAVSYGLFGPIFFLWIGLNIDLAGLIEVPALALALFGAAFAGKLAGTWLMVPLHLMDEVEAWAVGIGVNARLTTEIIVAQLLLTAGLIDERLFTALVAASSLSTLLVPPLLAVMLRHWGDEIRARAAPAVSSERPDETSPRPDRRQTPTPRPPTPEDPS